MKKLLGILFLTIITVFFTACDNNEGPFETRRENGHKVLYSNGKPAKGMIQNTWYNYNSGDTVVTAIYYVDKGIPAGDFSLYDRNGKLVINAEGKWKDNLFNGKIEEKDGTVAEGEFNINKDFIVSHEGLNVYDFSYDTLVSGNFKNKKYNFSKKNNKYDKKYIEYYSDGNIKLEISYDEGVYNGEYIEYYKNGNKSKETPYKNNKEHGIIKEYYEDGNIKAEVPTANGELNGLVKEYYKNGNVKYEVNAINGKADGLSKTYYNNGNLETETFFKNGEKEGLYKSYYKNGNIKEEASHKGNVLNGLAKIYKENGNLEKEIVFENGNVVSITEK